MNFNMIIGAIIVIALAAGAGATYAYFSDTETSTGNSVEAGVLDLSDGISEYQFNLGDMKPSYHKLTDPLTLTWTENPGKVYKKITIAGCDQGTQSAPEEKEENNAPKTDIYNYMWFDLKIGDAQVIPDMTVNLGDIVDKYIYLGTYGSYPSVGAIGGGSVTIQQSFHMWTNVTNWAQGDSCTITEQFLLEQDNAPMLDGCNDNSLPGTVCNGENPLCIPTAEVCNGEDDDCDQIVDDGFNIGQSCITGVGACQSAGVYMCSATHSGAECNAQAGDPSAEVCGDGTDNDCDGYTDSDDYDCAAICGDGVTEDDEQCDDGNDVNTDSCTNECKNAICGDLILSAEEECDDGNTASGDGCSNECTVEQTCTPSTEVCNGLDDNCNDFIDEETVMSLCGTGFTCEGTQGCVPIPTEPTCTDGIENGDETDEDCGGSCEACEIGDDWLTASDCEAADNCQATCTAGVCTMGACNSGFDDCNLLNTDGCEISLMTDANNCGTCGHTCIFAHAANSCDAGACQMGACTAGYADCNNNPSNGCEINTQTNSFNCGACGIQCLYTHAEGVCNAGACQMGSCTAGYLDCNGIAADGCEAHATSCSGPVLG